MKTFSIVLLAVVVGVAVARPEERYTDKFDNIDLDEILKSDRLTANYVNCLLDKKPCTPDGAELKRNLPDALHNECSKCTEKQKSGAKKVVKHIYRNKKNWWDELEKKYDPDHVYLNKHKEELDLL